MKSLILLKNLTVENANAIAGFTWGFPAISNFLGFTHALSRKLNEQQGLSLGGCAVICHQHNVQAHQPAGWGDYVFSLTRNPLTKKLKSPPFVEEARMHLNISLLIECDFTAFDLDFETGTEEQDELLFKRWITEKVYTQRLAGGTITNIGSIEYLSLPEDGEAQHKEQRKLLLRLLPGFVLVDRQDLLQSHHQQRLADQPDAELLDSWLDFIALKYQVSPDDIQQSPAPTEGEKATWQRIPKPASGWLVPITTGYQAISPLYEKGRVARTRDASVPFRFVESVHSIGQWISPHRISRLDSIIWQYQHNDDSYLCQNNYSSTLSETTNSESN
ncbi:MAG: type I-F CRISPR-associated protein Csy2 [Pontibacterium sp.]